MKRCLFCYQPLAGNEVDFHQGCSTKIFGQPSPPEVPFNEKEMEDLATQVVKRRITITGVQAKLSIDREFSGPARESKRFTIVGHLGGYILKPPTAYYEQLPEVEDLTMHLANIAKIHAVPHSLIRLQTGNLAYITKRIDRNKNKKLHMEDMCQLTGRLTEDKYHGSYEQVAKAIMNYSTNPGLDVVNFFEQVLFSFLTGNADMHLKNFSLIKNPQTGHMLSPAYDMVSTALVNPGDIEELALTLNGKKKKLNRTDFLVAFKTSELETKQQENIFKKMENAKETWMEFIDISFLKQEFKESMKALIMERFRRVEL